MILKSSVSTRLLEKRTFETEEGTVLNKADSDPGF
jgi:hypothetical protein